MKKMTQQNQFWVIKKFDKHRRRHVIKSESHGNGVHLITHIPRPPRRSVYFDEIFF